MIDKSEQRLERCRKPRRKRVEEKPKDTDPHNANNHSMFASGSRGPGALPLYRSCHLADELYHPRDHYLPAVNSIGRLLREGLPLGSASCSSKCHQSLGLLMVC